MNTNTKIVSCPTCGQPVVWDNQNPYRPFCSQHCKLIDLGAWASEEYNLPAQEDEPLSDTIKHH